MLGITRPDDHAFSKSDGLCHESHRESDAVYYNAMNAIFFLGVSVFYGKHGTSIGDNKIQHSGGMNSRCHTTTSDFSVFS